MATRKKIKMPRGFTAGRGTKGSSKVKGVTAGGKNVFRSKGGSGSSGG